MRDTVWMAPALLLGAAMIVSTGCAALPQQSTSAPATFPHRVATAHVELYWGCSQPDAGILRVEGVAVSRWSAQPIGFLELELVGVDAADRAMSGATGALPDIQLLTNQQSPFRMDLRTTGREVRYDLYYQYRYTEHEFHSALGPAVPWRLAQALQRFLIRDVCAADRHR